MRSRQVVIPHPCKICDKEIYNTDENINLCLYSNPGTDKISTVIAVHRNCKNYVDEFEFLDTLDGLYKGIYYFKLRINPDSLGYYDNPLGTLE